METTYAIRWYQMGLWSQVSTHRTIVRYQGEGAKEKASEFYSSLKARTNEAETVDRYYLVEEISRVLRT